MRGFSAGPRLTEPSGGTARASSGVEAKANTSNKEKRCVRVAWAGGSCNSAGNRQGPGAGPCKRDAPRFKLRGAHKRHPDDVCYSLRIGSDIPLPAIFSDCVVLQRGIPRHPFSLTIGDRPASTVTSYACSFFCRLFRRVILFASCAAARFAPADVVSRGWARC